MEQVGQLHFEDLHESNGRWDTHPTVTITRIVLLQRQLEAQFSYSTDFEIGNASEQLSRANATLDAVESFRETARATLLVAGANASMWPSLHIARWAFRMAEKLIGCPLTSEHSITLGKNLHVVEKHTDTWKKVAIQRRQISAEPIVRQCRLCDRVGRASQTSQSGESVAGHCSRGRGQ